MWFCLHIYICPVFLSVTLHFYFSHCFFQVIPNKYTTTGKLYFFFFFCCWDIISCSQFCTVLCAWPLSLLACLTLPGGCGTIKWVNQVRVNPVLHHFRPLGPLQYLRIWHDNSGKGKDASWLFSYMVVRDIQTGEEFQFISNEWLAVEEGDGQVCVHACMYVLPKTHKSILPLPNLISSNTAYAILSYNPQERLIYSHHITRKTFFFFHGKQLKGKKIHTKNSQWNVTWNMRGGQQFIYKITASLPIIQKSRILLPNYIT